VKGTISVTATLEQPELESTDPRAVGLLTEAKLRDWNLTYDYVEAFDLSEIRVVDWTQVRTAEHIADKDTLTEFRTQMTQGAIYPPIVIMHPDVLVDGNHRVAAAKALRRKTFPAFVVQFNSVDLAKSFSAAMNQLNGRRLTPQEAFEAATTMMARGMADEAIAREIGRGVTSVREMRRRNEFAERVASIPEITKMAEGIPEKARIKLAQISHNPAFAEAVKVIAETKAPARTVSEIVEAATSARTDADAITAVRAKRAELAPAGPPPHRVTIPAEVRQVTMHLGGLLKFTENPVSVLDVSSPERRTEALGKWQQVRDLAGKVIDLYGKQ
jgi:ParB-like chromosome segregation protein Spo0J